MVDTCREEVRIMESNKKAEEFDSSYNETTLHAAISYPSCGKKVWYGYGKNHPTRPIYCEECTRKELGKLMKCERIVSEGKTPAQLINYYLRKGVKV